MNSIYLQKISNHYYIMDNDQVLFETNYIKIEDLDKLVDVFNQIKQDFYNNGYNDGYVNGLDDAELIDIEYDK